jgi:hypothetical protein
MQYADIGYFSVKAFRIVQGGFNRPLIVDRFCARQVVDLFGLYETGDSVFSLLLFVSGGRGSVF